MTKRKAIPLCIIINMLIAFSSFLYLFIKCDGIITIDTSLNEQYLTYMMMANDCIKNGDIHWNWSINIGGSFLTCVARYALTPLFLFTLFFPSDMIPHLTLSMYIIKFTLAGLFSFLYLSRFVKNESALVGSTLYAFSGFSACILSWFVFLDSIATFPLLLIGLEELFQNKKRGLFAFTVFLNAITFYEFFIGQALFIILYCFIRCDTWEKIKNNFFKVLLEALLGVGMAAYILIPCLYATLNNERAQSKMTGLDLLLYDSPRKYLHLIKNFLLPSEGMDLSATFYNANYSASAGYLPFFGLILVITFWYNGKKLCSFKWIHKLILSCFLILFIPGLNNLPMGLNGLIYHRWLYMMLLVLALASSIIIDKRLELSFHVPFISTILLSILFIVGLLFSHGKSSTPIIFDWQQFWILNIIGISGMLFTYLIWLARKKDLFMPCIVFMVSIYACTITFYSTFITFTFYSQKIPQGASVNALWQLDIESPDDSYRFWSTDNIFMAKNHLNACGCYSSTLEPSIFELYSSWGLSHGVDTPWMPDEYFDLFSAKYYISDTLEENEPLMTYADSLGNNHFIYEKDYAVPIGWGYDSYITRSEYNQINAELDYDFAALIMIHTLVIPDELEPQISEVLTHTELSSLYLLSMEQEMIDLDKHRSESSELFEKNNDGFRSRITVTNDKYGFFSVPNSSGWTATVNGQEVNIVDICGLMAVPLYEGTNEIVFSYRTPYFTLGLYSSIFCFFATIVYMIINKKRSSIHP